jgi:DNA-binding winged helix-turn-helix (wHTH) protein
MYRLLISIVEGFTIYALIILVVLAFFIILIIIKLYVIRFDRLSEDYRKNVLLNKAWYRNFLTYFHGESILLEEKINLCVLNHDPKRAEIKFRDRIMNYKKESNEIKLLCCLIEANGQIVSSEQIVKKLDMPLSFEVDMGTKGYKKYLYETISRLRNLLIKEFNITHEEANELIVTVKDKGYRIGNPKNLVPSS